MQWHIYQKLNWCMIKCQVFGWLSSQSIWTIAQYPRRRGYLIVVWEFLHNDIRKDYHQSCFFNACWKLVDYCLGRREEGSCLFCFLTAAGLAHLVQHLSAETQSLKITEKWRHCLFSAMTISNGGPISSRRPKSSVPKSTFVLNTLTLKLLTVSSEIYPLGWKCVIDANIHTMLGRLDFSES